MDPSFNTWTILFLVAAAQGFFLAGMIALRKSKANNLLAALIAAFSLCLLFYVSFWTGYYQLLPNELSALQGLTYVFGPLCYFYVRSDRKAVKFSLWHFIPFALYLVYFIFTTWSSTSFGVVQVAVQNTHLLIYTLLIFQFVSSNRSYTNGALKLYNWRKKIAWAFLGYTASFLIYYVLVWTGTLRIEYDYMISIASSIFIYFIGYHGFQKQEVLKMYEQGKYDKSKLSPSASSSIHGKLIGFMESEKPYLNSTLKLQDLSERLGQTPHYLSQVINDLEGKNFADFINAYRIKEAQRLLASDDQKKIIHIAYDSGFNTKASFNNVFKKFTSLSPTEYRDSLLATT